VERGARSFLEQTKVRLNQMKGVPSAMQSEQVSKTVIDAAMAVVEEGDAVSNSAPPSKQIISKAAIRRLAHDVGARLAKDAHQTALEDLEKYVMKVMQHASGAMSFSRRKSVSLSHVLFAAGVCGGVPASLRAMQAEDLKRLSKCNPQAPPALRKDVLWRAEISEASFSKVAKNAAKQCHASLRITSQARRMLQLLAEYHIMKTFDKRGALGKPEEENPMSQNMMNVFECSQETAAVLVDVIEEVCNRTPELLAMSSVKTIDERLIRTALAPTRPWAQEWTPPEGFVEGKTVKVVERILRGRAADKRVTISASTFLAACFCKVVTESRGEVVGAGVPKAVAPAPKPKSAAVKVAPVGKAKAKKRAIEVPAPKKATAKATIAKESGETLPKNPPGLVESAPAEFSVQTAPAAP
jgi:histone H3/H4